MPCTTLLVGKKASYDGSTLMARNEDSGAGRFTAKKFIVVHPDEQPRHYRSVISKVEIDLPDNPMRYTAMPDAVPVQGIWGEAGINECNVAMSETETLTSNPRVLGADPLVEGGIGEEDMLTIVLPYIHSAREGVLRLGALLEQYGTYEMNGIGFQDLDEIWWLESVGGHHWMAKRVPDDAYVVVPNQQGIDYFDFKDALGEGKNHLCSADLADFIRENHLDLGLDGVDPAEAEDFDVRAALGSHSDADHCYNTPRAWYMLRCLNPTTFVWDGPDADFTPESDDLPWCMVPEHKITVEDVKYVLSSYYQGTEYNPYSRHGDLTHRGMYRPIGINRNNFVAITQPAALYAPRSAGRGMDRCGLQHLQRGGALLCSHKRHPRLSGEHHRRCDHGELLLGQPHRWPPWRTRTIPPVSPMWSATSWRCPPPVTPCSSALTSSIWPRRRRTPPPT